MPFLILYSWVFLATYISYLVLEKAKLFRFTELLHPCHIFEIYFAVTILASQSSFKFILL